MDLGKIRRVDSYSILNAVYFTCETVLVSNNDHFPIPPSKTVEEFEFKLAQWWQIKWVIALFFSPISSSFPTESKYMKQARETISPHITHNVLATEKSRKARGETRGEARLP